MHDDPTRADRLSDDELRTLSVDEMFQHVDGEISRLRQNGLGAMRWHDTLVLMLELIRSNQRWPESFDPRAEAPIPTSWLS